MDNAIYKNLIKRRNEEYSKAKKTRKPKEDQAWNKWKRMNQEVKEKCKEAKEKRLMDLPERINAGSKKKTGGDWWVLGTITRLTQATTRYWWTGYGLKISLKKANLLNAHFAAISSMEDPERAART